MKTRQTRDMKTERKDQEEMKTIRKKNQGIRIGKKKQLAILKPLKCRYCPWRFFSNTQRYLSHVHNHATHVKYYWYKNSRLHRPMVASIAVVPPRIICRPVYVKLHKLEFQCMENIHECCFCRQYFTTVYQKTLHEEYEHLCFSCEKTFENAQAKKLHKFETHGMKGKYGFKCRFCSRCFPTAKGKTVHENYEHICEFRCEDTFENITDKILHKQEIHGAEKHRCCVCGKFFGSASQKSFHEKYAHACHNFSEKTFEDAEVKKLHPKYPEQWRSHWGGKGGQSATPDSKKIAKNQEKSGKNGKNSGEIRKKEEKLGRKGKNQKISFTLPLLTDRAGYATENRCRQKTLLEKDEQLCHFCEKTFENAELKTKHELECDDVDNVNNKCHFCSTYFITAYKKILHEKYEHLCNFCEDAFENVEVKKTHELECDSVEKSKKCRFCSKCFATVDKKTFHEKYEHLEHLCTFCEKTFDNAEVRKTHELECGSIKKDMHKHAAPIFSFLDCPVEQAWPYF